MDSNNRNGGNNGGDKKNNRNLRSVLSLIGWALVLTLVFNYILAMTSGGKSFEITYSQMMNLVQEDQIKKIELKDGVLYATPVDGYTYTQESSNKNQQPRTYTQSEKNPITLYTTYLTDTRLLPLLDEHGVEYSSPVKSSWSVLGDILVMYILPMLLTMGLIVLVMRIVSKNGGGIGGIYVDGEDITNNIKDGELKGLIDIRDNQLTSLQTQLNELAATMKDAINQVHNRGTSYPNAPSELTGSRTFIDPANQNIQISNGDVRLTIFDSEGKQVATTTLLAGLGFPDGGGSVSDMVGLVNDWLTSPDGANLPQAYAEINDDGKLVINTGDSNYSFSIMDEASSTAGSDQQDVTIKFDVNGDGAYDRTMEGFSYFFGMNDFFQTTKNEHIYDSKVLNKNANLGVQEKITINFATGNNPSLGSINIYPNESLQDIVNKINNDPKLNSQIKASLVPNGNGYVLQINNTSGEQLEISEAINQTTGRTTGFLERIGMHPSNSDAAGSLSVREDLLTNPSGISSGTPEFNSNSGEYQLNPAANDIANAMAKVFTDAQDFGQAGSLAQTSTTLANYAATFVGAVATETNSATSALNYQQELTNSISLKEATLSGVDRDEELAQLIIFQQSYAACAQTFTASKEMLDMLLNMVN